VGPTADSQRHVALNSDIEITQLFDELRGQGSETAWSAFLQAYSEIIYGVIHSIAHNPDHAGDCFLFVCQKLSDRNFRRLCAFTPNGRARFTTWLRAVVRNLSLDWYRAEFGRRRAFRSLQSLEALDQEIFRAVFQRRLSVYETWQELSSSGIAVSIVEVEKRANTIRRMFSSRQLWLLSTSRQTDPTSYVVEEAASEEIVDSAPDPEAIAVLRQTHQKLSSLIQELSEGDRLVLRLRFDEELGLREISVLLGLKDAQTADRRIREAIARLRRRLGIVDPIRGKESSASV
jgi:RNA polymerase sigma factor (sigma-70 family)